MLEQTQKIWYEHLEFRWKFDSAQYSDFNPRLPMIPNNQSQMVMKMNIGEDLLKNTSLGFNLNLIYTAHCIEVVECDKCRYRSR